MSNPYEPPTEPAREVPELTGAQRDTLAYLRRTTLPKLLAALSLGAYAGVDLLGLLFRVVSAGPQLEDLLYLLPRLLYLLVAAVTGIAGVQALRASEAEPGRIHAAADAELLVWQVLSATVLLNYLAICAVFGVLVLQAFA